MQLIPTFSCKFCSYYPVTQIAGISYRYFKVQIDQKNLLEATRILTPRDFERLAEYKKKMEANNRKRKRNSSDHYAAANVTYAYSHDIDSGTTVQPGDLEGYRVQKKRDLKEMSAETSDWMLCNMDTVLSIWKC